jgi:hypothetical protein
MESMGERVQGCSGKRSTGTRRVSCLLMLVLTSFSATGATHRVQAQTVAHKGWVGSGLTIDPWWKGAVFYELDPLTFQDSNGDGFGDLRGIAERLDYLKTLGVDALVLSPFELQKGAGSAFEAVYGKEEDFDQLEREASLRTMRVLVDVPIGPKHSTEAAAGRGFGAWRSVHWRNFYWRNFRRYGRAGGGGRTGASAATALCQLCGRSGVVVGCCRGAAAFRRSPHGLGAAA